MQILRQLILVKKRGVIVVLCFAVVLLFGFVLASRVSAQAADGGQGERLITVHDGTKEERGLLTHAATLREVFQEAGIAVDPRDHVEPGLDEPLVANHYEVNIYRARPVTIIDGKTSIKVMSPHRTAKQIAKEAGITLQDEDITEIKASTDFVAEGAGIQLTITRATKFSLVLYGKKTTAYTQADTVAAMLKEKNIALEANDTVSTDVHSPIHADMTIEIWRDGIQTVSEEEEIPFETEKILDMDHEIGYHEIKAAGKPGLRIVTYQVEMQGGKEMSRKKIQSVTSKEPVKQVELVGNKPRSPLSKSKGAGHFVDSQGVSHRETYYDLPMNVVIGACGGGTYSIREDGAKIDQDGYILIAANYSRYPRCSIVETSMGLGKVYDTGGFAKVHPDGFDLATDWTNYDGR